MRCRSCDMIMMNHPGWVELEDGTKIEEELCGDCRSAALYPPEAHSFALEELTELSFINSPNGLTMPRKMSE